MTVAGDVASWQQANDGYIGAAIEWLRLILERQIPPTTTRVVTEPRVPSPPTPSATPQAQSSSSAWWRFGRASDARDSVPPAAAPKRTPLALPPASSDTLQWSINDALEKMRAAGASHPPPALSLLAQRLGLSPFERDVLLLCVAMEFDTRIGALCALAQEDHSLPFPTFGLAFTLFDAPAWDARSPERPLRYWRLIEVNQPWGYPLTTSALRADERIVNFVKGLGYLDERLAAYVAPFADVESTALPDSHRRVVDEILHALDRDQPNLRPIQLLGRDPEGKHVVASAVSQQLGLTLYRMPADLVPLQMTDLETFTRLWQRETLLLPIALYIDASGIDPADAQAAPLRRFLGRSSGVLFVEGRATWPTPLGSDVFDIDKPTPSEQRDVWLGALGEGHEEEAAEHAAQFNLGITGIARIVTAAAADDAAIPLHDRLWARARQQTQLRIDALAQRIDAKATWEHLVLPAAEAALLHQIAAHVDWRGRVYDEWGFRERMNRGLGISALFAGASGTGKTMAAEVIANELGVSLHRIDLSSVVSKWVGETEKNLQQLFNAADDANGILFFDEADALFGKRTEVQQSQDRFANIEINFLLQRLESYRGLAILATNMKSALDPAFLRRLRFIVNFPFPGPEERKAIWTRAFPEQTPKEGLDFDRLAKLALTGGSVHNVALSAAFLAAKRDTPVTMPIVFEAARTEMRKIEKPVQEADFRWTEKVVEMVR